MADGTHIEWTDATWNPITGCSVVSPGCTNCYAMKLAGTRLQHHPSRSGLTMETKAGPVWNGQVRFNEGWLDQPLRWRKPRMIFVCAHGDLFHEAVPDEWIDRIFATMAMAMKHTFQVLTKRPALMKAYLTAPGRRDAVIREMYRQGAAFGAIPWPLSNVWLGVSVEDQARANERVPILLDTPAAVRWISAEPLLGPVDLTTLRRYNPTGKPWIDGLRGLVTRGGYLARSPSECSMSTSTMIPGELPGIDWVVVGGESGPRPMHPDWARSLRDQCVQADVPFLFKQWGAWLPWEPEHGPCWKAQNGRSADGHALFPADMDHDPTWDDGLWAIPEEEHFAFQRVGKKAAGRKLDGVTWDQYPGGGPQVNRDE